METFLKRLDVETFDVGTFLAKAATWKRFDKTFPRGHFRRDGETFSLFLGKRRTVETFRSGAATWKRFCVLKRFPRGVIAKGNPARGSWPARGRLFFLLPAQKLRRGNDSGFSKRFHVEATTRLANGWGGGERGILKCFHVASS